MSFFSPLEAKSLIKFPKLEEQLAIVKRVPINGADQFFKTLMQTEFSVIGQVFKQSSKENIKFILDKNIPLELQSAKFYELWIKDMAELCDIFCDILNNESVSFNLGTNRGCKRYHVDNVPMRLLVTYAGKGTEWLPSQFADRHAFEAGKPNEEILKDPSGCEFINIWDIAVFRGGRKGVLHRTPDAALNGPSIMLRLDEESFWNDVLGQSTMVYT